MIEQVSTEIDGGRAKTSNLVAFVSEKLKQWRLLIAWAVTLIVTMLVQFQYSYPFNALELLAIYVLTLATAGISGLPELVIGENPLRWRRSLVTASSGFFGAAVVYFLYLFAQLDSGLRSLYPTGLAIGAATGLAATMASFESRSRWAGSAGLCSARAAFVTAAAMGSAVVVGLAAAEAVEGGLAHRLDGTALEGVVVGIADMTAIVVGGLLLLGARLVWRLAARRQLSGHSTARAMNQATWVLALMTGFYPPVVGLLPRWLGDGWRSPRFVESTATAGLLGGLTFVLICFSGSLRAPHHAALLVVLPEVHPSRRARALAKRLARRWTFGPVTLVAPPRAAPAIHGPHVAVARAAGLVETLFPASAVDLEHYHSSLPSLSNWDSLPKRECFPHTEIWGDTVRRLGEQAVGVIVVREGVLPVARDEDDSEARLAEIAQQIPSPKLWLAQPPTAPNPLLAQSGIYDLTTATAAVAESLIGALNPESPTVQMRHIAVFHEPDDLVIARALVELLNGRRTEDSAIVSASCAVLAPPSLLSPYLILRCSSWIFRSKPGDLQYLLSWVFRRWLDAQNRDRRFVLLERPLNKIFGTTRNVVAHAQLLSLAANTTVVRLDRRPFAQGERSVFGAHKHAGYISDANVSLHLAKVAKRLLAERTEAIEPGPPVTSYTDTADTAKIRSKIFRPKVFVCYRRTEGAEAGRIYSALVEHLGARNVIRDVTFLSAGDDFASALEAAIGESNAVIAVIGRDWEKRLQNPEDWIRFELEHALAKGVRVLPVLVDSRPPLTATGLPDSLRSLAELHSVPARDADFEHDVARLLGAIGYRAWHRTSVRVVLPIVALLVTGAFPATHYFQLREWNAVLVANFAQGQWDAADVAADRVLALDPKNVRALSAKGSAAALSGQYRTADKYFQQAYDLDPANRVTRRNLAYAYLHSGRPDDAVKLYEGLRDGSAGAEYSVACAYAGAKRYADALRVLQALPATQADPGHKNPKGQPAVLEAAVLMALDSTGNRTRALTRLRFGIAQSPDYWLPILELKTVDPQNDYTDQLALLRPILTEATSEPAPQAVPVPTHETK